MWKEIALYIVYWLAWDLTHFVRLNDQSEKDIKENRAIWPSEI